MRSLLVLCAVLCSAWLAEANFPNTIDLLSGEELDHLWMEIGYTPLNIHTWTEVTTTVVNFNADGDRPMVVYFSLPEYGNSSAIHSFPIVPKMDGPAYRNDDGSYSFKGILVMPDDAECSKEFWVPEDPGSMVMAWMIAEEGVYNLTNNMLIVQQGNITRENSNPVKSDTPWLNHHTVVFNYTTGCNHDDLEEPCTFPEHPDDGSLDHLSRYYPWMKIGSLQQLQTSRRKANSTHTIGQDADIHGVITPPKELFLSVRGRRVFTDRARYMVATHSVDTSRFPDYEDVHIPELLGFLIYEKSVRIRCTEGLVIETQIFYDVTSTALTFSYLTEFNNPPGLFAMLGSLNSVADSTILRSFNRTNTFSQFITQEEQCVDWEQLHTTPESAFAFVVGESTLPADAPDEIGVQQMNCFAVFKNNAPTGIPSSQPTVQPTGQPSGEPTGVPSGEPSVKPSGEPTGQPSGEPSGEPTGEPSGKPSGKPSGSPSGEPTGEPSGKPSGKPSGQPSVEPSGEPSGQPSGEPTCVPFGGPSAIPTGEPSSVPSSCPTGEPSGVPSGVPVSQPTSEPTRSPTLSPTASPTYRPTRRPTLSPTRFPTAIPTLLPTSAPSKPAGNCTFNFLMFDLFGDGFYTTYVNLTTTNHIEENSTTQFHQPNCTAKVVSVYSETCSIDVSMLTLDDSHPLLTWESYWVLNHEGETYIGDFHSKLSIVYGKVTYSHKLVDYSVPGEGGNKCHECKHPPKHNANIPPGVCEGSVTAKACPPAPPGMPAPGKGGKGGAGGPDAGKGGKGGPGGNKGGKGGPDGDKGGKGGPGGGKGGFDDDKGSDKDDDSFANSTDSFFDRFNSTDDGSGAGNDDHIHYSHGKPRPKPKPPYLVYINMYDELSNGYLDKSGDWSDVFDTQELVGSGGEYAELTAPILVPNVMTYPKYYIMTKDRQKLVKPPKSICAQNRGTEFCQEALPWNGHFIYRFAGIEPSDPADAATWEFCGLSGGINEEFEFIMRDGVCYPLSNKLTATVYCKHGFETAISMNGAFNIAGNFDSLSSLSELDTSILEKELADLLPGELSVTIQSVTHEDDGSFNVYFKTSIIAESVGYDGSQVDKVETMMYELEATLANGFQNGLMRSRLINDLDAIADTEDDVLRQVTSIKLLGYMEIDRMNFQDKHVSVSSHSGDIGGSWSVPENIELVISPGSDASLHETASIISLAGVVVGALVVMLVATSVVKYRSGEVVNFGLPAFGAGLNERVHLPDDSEHAVAQDTQIEESSVHHLSALRQSHRPVIDLSLSSVESGHRAIHYADDIDAALFNHSKLSASKRQSFI